MSTKVKAEDWPTLIFGGIAIAIIIALITGLFYGWILMLLLGAVHGTIAPAVPAVSYAACFWPAVLIRILVSQNNTAK